MWYVMQVRTGSEENIQLQCQKDISSDILEDCFIPYYEEKKNIKCVFRFPASREALFESAAGVRTYEAFKDR